MPDPIISDQTPVTLPPTFPEMADIPTMPQASGPIDIPPMITEPKIPKKKSGRIIATILGILVLVGAVGAGVVLVGQQQDIREKAAADYCPETFPDVPSSHSNYTAISCIAKSPYCMFVGYVGGNFGPHDNITRAQAVVVIVRYFTYLGEWQWVNPTIPFFPDVPTSHWAYKEIETAKANGYIIGYGDGTFKPEDPWIYGICIDATGKSKVCDLAPMTTMTRGKYAQRLYDIGMARNSFPLCSSVIPTPKPTPTPTGALRACNTSCQANEQCSTGYCATQGSVCRNLSCPNDIDCICARTPTPTPTPPPTPTPTPTATATPTATPTMSPTPTATPIIAACSTVKAYNTDWDLLSGAQLSTLHAGDIVRFTVSGIPADQIDKARFTINGVLKPETINKKPGTNEYYYEYTIPAGVYSFTVTAQIHHLTLGWF